MSEKKLLKRLKIIMVIGICLILTGHYLLSYTNFTEQYGVHGFMIGAGLIAIGLILSLPTKMYLTFTFVTRENDKNKKLSQDSNKSS